MTESLSKRPWLSRRSLIRLIVLMAIIQIGILAYLWTLLRPSRPQEIIAEATPAPHQLPTQSPRTDTDPTPVPATEPGETAVGPAMAATNYAQRALMVDEEQALDHLAHLASDDLEGRQPGTPGGQAAGEYIAASFAAYGLQPAGVNDTYYQTFTVPYGRITDLPVLTIISPQGETLTRAYDYRTDYRALTGGYIGAGEGEGPVVWLNECLHDDYAGLDMAGKIALCHYSRDPQIYRQAIEHQVGGLLLLDREGQISISRRPGYRETSWVPQTIPTYLISETVASDLLTSSRYTLDDLSLRFTPTPLSTTVRIAVAVEEQDEVKARNVLGVLPGSDPDHRDEIVVVGAHYDHLGREPDGAIMYGANDNASGVAILLEIARLWQTQGYQPARSILFAAWDGEEQGLLGSRHYAHDPTYALTHTIAMLNLDMVGAGDTLHIDGDGGGMIATQLQASAETYGVTTTLTFDGRSDHIAFYEVGVPAANLIWWPDAFYHTPDDTTEAIAPDKLKAVGVLSSHALAALAEGHIALEQAVERLRASILAGDRQAFLAGIDPYDPDLQASQLTWFDNLWSRELVQATSELSQMRIGDGEADIALTVAYKWADAARPTRSVSYDVRFVQRDDEWYFAGYELDSLSGSVVTVARFPDVPVGTSQLLSTTQDVYLSLAADLGFEPIAGTRFIYYSGDEAMRAIAQPAVNQPTPSIVSSAGLAEIAWGRPITPALVHLALNQMGLPPAEGDWLRQGLILHYEDGGPTEHFPVLAAAGVFTSLLDFPDLSGQPTTESNALRAYAWSATEYLLDHYGPEGLRALCAAWGRTNDPGQSFQDALRTPVDQFESAWRTERIIPLHADAEAIQATIAARVEAVLAGNEAGFLETVYPADPVLRAEERNWFRSLASDSSASYAASGEVIDWSPGSEETVVLLTTQATGPGGQHSQATYAARFVRDGGHWFYAGLPWTERASEHFLLKHQDHDTAWAECILALAEESYAQVTADLNGTPPLPQEIKIYDDEDTFRASVSPSLPPGTDGWTEPGEAIKLPLGDGSERTLQHVIAHELTHQVLSAQGLETDWLHEGIASFEAGRVIPFGSHWMAGRYLPVVQEAVRRYAEFPLYKMPAWEDVPADQAELYYAQSWSFVSAISEHSGLPGLRQFVAQSISSDDTAANLHAVLAVDPQAFRDDWRDHIYAARVPEELLSLAQRFDARRALAHIETLSSPEFAGRQAGTYGADLAAAYIAEQFTALGLQPHLQQFPISHTRLISVPTFTLLDNAGAVLHEFVHNDDFVERGGRGFAEGDLVWLSSDNLEGLHFGGAVVLREDVQDSAVYAAELQARGAGGLIIANGKNSEYLQTHHTRDTASDEATIPVFEITDATFDSLLVQLGMEYAELFTYPSPALPLGVGVRQSLTRLPVTTAHTVNVLGLWPGSDPEVADEVLLIGAHYDHIGQSPDGLYFPGANQNASGIGTMLEMARVWQSTGYRPARSVLFAAWGAEETDSAGVAHYLVDPAIPLTRTVGVIALDSVAGGRGFKLLFHGTREHDAPLVHRIDAAANRLDRRAWRRPGTGEGWHEPFNQADIPTLKLIWDRAEDDFYSLTDTADAIDLDRLATTGEILTLTTAWLAGR